MLHFTHLDIHSLKIRLTSQGFEYDRKNGGAKMMSLAWGHVKFK